jgi:hypothetical protein
VYGDFRVGIVRPYYKIEGGVEAVVGQVETTDGAIFDGVNKLFRPDG